MRHIRLALIALIACAPAQAAIYKYVDADGNVTFSDKYRRGAVKLDYNSNSPVTISTPRSSRSVSQPSPANFPRVDSSTQRQRDDIRRTLLLEERDKEVKGLESARTTLNTPTKRSPSELDRLSENVRRHQKNIEMLDKELARIK